MLSRGWLSRLELVSSDKEEFCRLDCLLISIAVEGGNRPGPEQVCFQQVISIANCTTLSIPVSGCLYACSLPLNAYDMLHTLMLHFLRSIRCTSCGHPYLVTWCCLLSCLFVCLSVPRSVCVCLSVSLII